MMQHRDEIRQALDQYLKQYFCEEASQEQINREAVPKARASCEESRAGTLDDKGAQEEAPAGGNLLECADWAEDSDESEDTAFESALPEFARGASLFLPKETARRELDAVLAAREETFSHMLLRLIDEKELRDSDVYKRANIDRRLFSKIRGDEDYVPSKKTAISFCLALQLEPAEAESLLAAAGYALSSAARFDLIIRFLIENQEYDVQFANETLDDYGEGSLFR